MQRGPTLITASAASLSAIGEKRKGLQMAMKAERSNSLPQRRPKFEFFVLTERREDILGARGNTRMGQTQYRNFPEVR
jgi:hypothetical protein